MKDQTKPKFLCRNCGKVLGSMIEGCTCSKVPVKWSAKIGRNSKYNIF